MSIEFEVLCLTNMVNNPAYIQKVMPFMRDDYFESVGAREVFRLLAAFVAKYDGAPTKDVVVVGLADAKLNEIVFEQAVQVVDAIDGSTAPMEYLIDKTEAWLRDRSLYLAIQQAITIYDGKDKNHTRLSIPDLVSNALAVSLKEPDIHDYFKDAEKFYEKKTTQVMRIPFGIEIMNRLTRRGIKKKSLNVVQAGINVGKTTWLIDQAAHFLSLGKNVMYFTLEIDCDTLRERVDARVFGQTFDEVDRMTKDVYLSKVHSIRRITSGDLKIKEYPSGAASVVHFRHTLKELKTYDGFTPDLIVVDYITIMAAAAIKHNGNSNTYYTHVASELRALAWEFDVPVWTAAQFNRGGQTSTDVKINDIGEAIGIAGVADFMVAFTQPDEMAQSNQAVGKVLKNRYANKSKGGNPQFLIGLDNDTQRYFDVVDQENSGMISPANSPIAGMGGKPHFAENAEESANWKWN